LPADAAVTAQLATGVGPVSSVLQVVVVQLLPEAAVAGVQEATPVGPVVLVAQVVAV